jgi:hypothetical protein
MKDVVDLCLSLGFFCHVDPHSKNLFFGYGSGMMTLDFTVKSKGVGKYHGFTVNGNGRFVLGNYIITHNTCLSIYLMSQLKFKNSYSVFSQHR